MKRLKVPVIPVLDVLDITSIEPILEVQSQREFLTHANWHEYPYKPITAFNIARTEKNLYIRYSVQGNSLKASYEMDNSSVHKDSCVEFFMKKEGDSHYMNFEFNCIGTCDAARRTSRDIKTSLSQEEYKSIIRLGNFYKCADETMNPHFVSWSPIDLPEPNFHCPEFFGEIYL